MTFDGVNFHPPLPFGPDLISCQHRSVVKTKIPSPSGGDKFNQSRKPNNEPGQSKGHVGNGKQRPLADFHRENRIIVIRGRDAPSKNPKDFSKESGASIRVVLSLSFFLSLSSRHLLLPVELWDRDIPSVAIDDRFRAIMQLIDKREGGKKIGDTGENDREDRAWLV